MSPTASTSTTITTRISVTSFCVSIGSTWICVGASRSATPSSMTWATMLPTLMSRPPDATADARSTPCFCRKRICAAMPPIAGTARFENDMESWSSAVRINGRLIGTVPMSAIAVAKLVRSEMTIATTSQNRSALVIVSQSSCGLADLAQQGEDGDERADRHHEVGAADPVELLERWFVGARGRRGGGAHRRDLLRPLLAVAPVDAHLAAQRGRLEVGERLDERRVTETLASCGHGAVVAHEERGAHEQLGDVGGASSRSRRARRDLEAADADHGAVDDDVPGVEATVGDARLVQRRHLPPQVVEQLVGDGAPASSSSSGTPPSGRTAMSAAPGPAAPATTTGGTRTSARSASSIA